MPDPEDNPTEETNETDLDETTDETPEGEEPAGEERPEDKPVSADEVEVETRTEVKKKEEKPEPKEGEEVDPEDVVAIGKVVKKETADLRESLRQQKDTVEVDAFIRDNPDHSKYRAAALKYMANPAYSNIPAHNIMAILASKDQQAIGAKKEREAAAKAEETKGGGVSARKPSGGKVDWSKASREDVEAQRNKVLGRNI